MSDFYEEQISDLEDHVGGLEIDLKEASQEIERLREALEEIHKQSFKKKYWDIRDITNEALEVKK
mgnify:CR=1 FL=1